MPPRWGTPTSTSPTRSVRRSTGARDAIVNAAAFTDVDGAETALGRPAAWRANAAGPAALSQICRKHGSTLIHLSTEYVFDGRARHPYPGRRMP